MRYDVNEYLPYMIQPGTSGFEEVGAYDFLRLLFPDDSLEGEGERTGKYNSFLKVIDRKARVCTTVFLHDDLAEIPHTYTSGVDCFISPVSYYGKRPCTKSASEVYALDLDIDSLLFETQKGKTIPTGMICLAEQFGKTIPTPTAIVCSGNGIHIWYVFSERLLLYPNIKSQLQKAKDYLTKICWSLASDPRVKAHCLPLVQFSRLPDSPTKYGDRCVGYLYDGGKKLSLDDLNRYLPEDAKIQHFGKSRMSLEEAKERYPEWYERRIEQKLPKLTCTAPEHFCTQGMYAAWLCRMNQVTNGHRFFYLYVLAIYAYRCSVSGEQLLTDALRCSEYFSGRTPDDPLTVADVQDAISIYHHPEKCRISNRRVQELCGVSFEHRTDRHTSRRDHLRRARQNLAEKRAKNPEEYGSKREEIARWRLMHPTGAQKECVNETGISQTTVYKWWKICLNGDEKDGIDTEPTKSI